jgi:hypothetical protein
MVSSGAAAGLANAVEQHTAINTIAKLIVVFFIVPVFMRVRKVLTGTGGCCKGLLFSEQSGQRFLYPVDTGYSQSVPAL